MSKYVIKNCPACRQYQVGIYTCDDLYDCDLQRCQDCTDCIMKKIAEKCKEHHTDLHFTPSEILALLDIEECE